MLGFNPDLVINLDGFNEIALTLSENYDSGIEPIFPRSFAQTIHAAAANRSCADFNNFLTSSNSKVPVIELIGLYFIKSCHHSITGPTKVTPYWGQGKAIEKEYIDKAVNIWEASSNRISDLLNSSNSLYIHAIQPNQYLENFQFF